MNREQTQQAFERWARKLRVYPAWDVRLEWVELMAAEISFGW